MKLTMRFILILWVALLLGCQQQVEPQTLPNTTQSGPPPSYTGPAADSTDVLGYQTEVWDNLRANNRCGNCHGLDGQALTFVRDDNINDAYDTVLTAVDRINPENSLLVTKVAGGHNCWLTSSSACGEIITAYLNSWLYPDTNVAASTEIELTAPTIKDAGASKQLPNAPGNFSTTVWPLLTEYCAECHTDTATTPEAPYFAHSNIDIAYEAVKNSEKIDLNNPADSRLVVRLSGEFHNCWDDCTSNAAEMEAAITSFADGIAITPIDPALVISKALSLQDGLVASGGNRIDSNAIALYQFKTGSGNILYDISGVEPALNLSLIGAEGEDYDWVGGWGIEFKGGRAQGTVDSSSKLAQRIKQSGEYSVEAWVIPANVTQEGPARIISYSSNTSVRNFTLGQTLYNYNFAQRSANTDANGQPMLSTPDADEVLQATQQHVVITYDLEHGRKIYVNGVSRGMEDDITPGSLSDWSEGLALVLGDEAGGERPWHGKLRLVAIHDQALNESQIQQNFEAGVGEKYFLLFSISDLVDTPQSYIMLEVSQFDNYSYLFHTPRYVSLEDNPSVTPFNLAGMRIGINGKEPSVGQAYMNLNLPVNDSGQILTSAGTILALENGPESDEFFLTFEQLGTHSDVRVEPAPLSPVAPVDGEPQPAIGLRTFDEINATMSILTEVSATQADVKDTYQTIRQQLPTVENVNGFLSAHQVAVSQLAIEYCNALVEDATLRSSYFPGFDFTAPASSAFDTTGKRDLLLNPMLDTMLGSNLATQPDAAQVKTELNNLIDRLTACGGSCAADRTLGVAKGSCAALLGSAVILMQ